MDKISSMAKTKQQMADEYGVCWKTFDKWLKKHKIKIDRGLITPKDQNKIYSALGIPKNSKLFK
jgi:hypothetical protein